MHMVPEVADAGNATRLGSGQLVRAHTPYTASPCCSHQQAYSPENRKSNHTLRKHKDGMLAGAVPLGLVQSPRCRAFQGSPARICSPADQGSQPACMPQHHQANHRTLDFRAQRAQS